jgi:arylsulfatase A-like enzyme
LNTGFHEKTMKKSAMKLLAALFAALLLLPACSGEKEKPNILLITIDTLRRDHLGVYGYPRKTSPFMDSLAKEGTVFKNAVTPIPITAAGHATILTSLHPLTHQLLNNGEALKENVQTIAEVLRDNGYYTVGTVGAKMMTVKSQFNQGFMSFSDKYKSWERDAQKVNEAVFQQVDRYLSSMEHKNKPLFLWIHYYDPHAPYHYKNFEFKNEIPDYMVKRYPMRKFQLKRYDNEIRFVDEAVKDLFGYLKSHNLDKQLLTCITADHGEQHGEHGYVNIHCDFYTENTFVPLILHGHDIPKGKTIERYVSTMDISKTLLNMAGLAFEYQSDGIDLFETPKEKRDFLIIGHPSDIKSLQLIRRPMSYVLNHDRFYRYWYFSDTHVVPEKQLRIVKQKNISVEDKTLKHFTVYIPDAFQIGVRYALISARLEDRDKTGTKKKDPNKVVMVTFNRRLHTRRIVKKKIEYMNIVHPITTLDRQEFKINFLVDRGIEVTDIKYVLLTEKEFMDMAGSFEQWKSNVFGRIRSRRKDNSWDELYHLPDDIDMVNNLLKGKNAEKYRRMVPLYKKSLYRLYESYRQKGMKLLGDRERGKKLSKDQVKMLKSLGYL